MEIAQYLLSVQFYTGDGKNTVYRLPYEAVRIVEVETGTARGADWELVNPTTIDAYAFAGREVYFTSAPDGPFDITYLYDSEAATNKAKGA